MAGPPRVGQQAEDGGLRTSPSPLRAAPALRTASRSPGAAALALAVSVPLVRGSVGEGDCAGPISGLTTRLLRQQPAPGPEDTGLVPGPRTCRTGAGGREGRAFTRAHRWQKGNSRSKMHTSRRVRAHEEAAVDRRLGGGAVALLGPELGPCCFRRAAPPSVPSLTGLLLTSEPAHSHHTPRDIQQGGSKTQNYSCLQRDHPGVLWNPATTPPMTAQSPAAGPSSHLPTAVSRVAPKPHVTSHSGRAHR